MAITTPEHITFSNEKVRIAADRLVQAYNFARLALDEWFANEYNTDIPNSDTEIVRDSASPEDDLGTNGDGRKVISGQDLHNVMTRLSELTSDYESTNNAKLNTILAVSVNENV